MNAADRKIYLIRHAKPDFPTEERYCIGGGTDWPIGEEGRKQCEQLAAFFLPVLKKEKESGHSVQFWSSPMLRARQTAQYLAEDCEQIHIQEGLQEAFAGDWEGKPFSWIREHDADAYNARSNRAQGMSLIPGAESNEEVLHRSCRALKQLLEESEADDIVLVIHGTVIQMLLASMKDEALEESRKYRPEYTGIVELSLKELRAFLINKEP